MKPEREAEVVMDGIRRHPLMDSRRSRADSIEFLENLQTLLEMELDGLREDQKNAEDE